MEKQYYILAHIIVAFLYSINTIAIPAYPYKTEVITDNGKTAIIYMKGDESFKYAITTDGYTLLNDTSGWWYATKSENGKLMKSKFKLMTYEDETSEIKNFKRKISKGIIPTYDSIHDKYSMPEMHRVKNNTPVIGERRALVILMQYKDVSFKKTIKEFVSLFNQIEYHENNATGSVRDFYKFASQGQLDYISDIYGPYTSKYPMSYYGGNSTLGGNDGHAVDLCIEAMKSLPDDIDYSIYDNNKDGLVDNVHIIFAGYGEEAGASSDAIWAHEYPHRISLKNEIGVSLAGYSCSPELKGNHGTKITNIGVICHELGHALGAMDYYDTNYATGGEFEGTGKWDIMASGSWNDDGRTPPNFNPYVRSEIFGWDTQTVLTSNQQIIMPRRDIDNPHESTIYRLETGAEGDYFLLENRQKYDFDSALPGAGLLIYHVHPNIDRYRSTNTINASHPQGLYPVCASFSEPNKRQYGNINSTECPFPGSKVIRSFSASSSPNAVAWNGSLTEVSLSNISMNASEGIISFSTYNDTIVEHNDPDIPTRLNLVYSESFENSIKDSMIVSSFSGKEVWKRYKKGLFVVNPDLIPDACDGKCLLMLYSGKESKMSESEIIGPDIEVVAGDNYTICFDLYTYSATNELSPTMVLYIEDKYGEYNIYSFSDINNEWKTIEIPLVFADNMFHYKIYGQIFSGGIFIDNIRLYKEDIVNSVNFRETHRINDNEFFLYKADGTYIGKYTKSKIKIQSGFYLIRHGALTNKFLIK